MQHIVMGDNQAIISFFKGMGAAGGGCLTSGRKAETP